MKIICISGKARAGKDTFAGYLYNKLNLLNQKVLIFHYGDLVKYYAKMFFEWDGNKDEEGRSLLQYIGTDVVRSIDPNYWCNFAIDVFNFFGDKWDYVIIPDCRFPNEIDTMKNSKYETIHIHINRPDFDNSLTEEQKNHPSETSMDNYPKSVIVYNDSTLEDFERLAEIILYKTCLK